MAAFVLIPEKNLKSSLRFVLQNALHYSVLCSPVILKKCPFFSCVSYMMHCRQREAKKMDLKNVEIQPQNWASNVCFPVGKKPSLKE